MRGALVSRFLAGEGKGFHERVSRGEVRGLREHHQHLSGETRNLIPTVPVCGGPIYIEDTFIAMLYVGLLAASTCMIHTKVFCKGLLFARCCCSWDSISRPSLLRSGAPESSSVGYLKKIRLTHT